jgi:tetratricopeptide (TPR) repeat protein
VIAVLLAVAVAAAPPAGAADPAARLAAANALQLAGDDAAAARAYEALAEEGWDGPDLRLGLGNARLGLGERGRAIASFERALRLDPWDADAQANLELARAANVDRLVGAGGRSAAERLVRRTPPALAAWSLAAAWWLLWGALALRRRARGPARGVLAAIALGAGIASGAAGALVAAAEHELAVPAAVVVAPATPAREGPSRTLRPSFELHEGTLVRILEDGGDLVRARLENGLEGWIAAEDVERL